MFALLRIFGCKTFSSSSCFAFKLAWFSDSPFHDPSLNIQDEFSPRHDTDLNVKMIDAGRGMM